MNKLKNIIVSIIFVLTIISCQSKDNKVKNIEVNYTGALKTMMSGNLKATVSLDSLSKKKNFYALGAVENLKGEIQIFNSKPTNSFVLDSSLLIDESFNLKAALLVYAEVEEWKSYSIEKVTNKKDLESAIFKMAKTNGIDTEKPFPFLLEGKIESLDWHVINWKDGDTIHNHQKHKESGLNGSLNNTEVQIIGFHSTKHKAVFTHHTTNIHMHFKTNDSNIAGHIDDLKLAKTITLKLPKQ